MQILFFLLRNQPMGRRSQILKRAERQKWYVALRI